MPLLQRAIHAKYIRLMLVVRRHHVRIRVVLLAFEFWSHTAQRLLQHVAPDALDMQYIEILRNITRLLGRRPLIAVLTFLARLHAIDLVLQPMNMRGRSVPVKPVLRVLALLMLLVIGLEVFLLFGFSLLFVDEVLLEDGLLGLLVEVLLLLGLGAVFCVLEAEKFLFQCHVVQACRGAAVLVQLGRERGDCYVGAWRLGVRLVRRRQGFRQIWRLLPRRRSYHDDRLLRSCLLRYLEQPFDLVLIFRYGLDCVLWVLDICIFTVFAQD